MVETEGWVMRCVRMWDELWQQVIDRLNQVGALEDALDDLALADAIRRSINSPTKTYRYVLPTQLIAKLANPALDAKCIQMQRGGTGAFDARTIAHEVIVPFDRSNLDVLGGAPEPYVNNPLRVPEVSLDPTVRGQQKNKAGWDDLYTVLDAVQQVDDATFTALVLRQTQIEIARRLSAVRVVYPIPRRISAEQIDQLVTTFISVPSGGDRPEVVATALFYVIGENFGLYETVQRSKTNAADAASGQSADIECLDALGKVVFAVEVKDRHLQINHISDKLGALRERNVADIFYLVRDGVIPDQQADVKSLIERQFSSGQNLYVFDLLAFARVIFALVGEAGRRDFLEKVGTVLDTYHSPLVARRAWAELMGDI